MMIEINDVLNLIGRDLKDGSNESMRFREFIAQEKWTTEQIKKWLDECLAKGSGAHDPYNRAFQDLIVSLGGKLGFNIEYGRYAGKPGEDNYDGIWKKESGDTIVTEVKTSTWPIGTIGQLGEYLEGLSRKEEAKSVFGLYVIGKGDVQPLTEQIVGSKYKDMMRLILYEDLIEVINLKDELEPVIGKENALEKTQNLLLPIESINIGNIVRFIIEIATSRSTAIPDEPPDKPTIHVIDEPPEEPWAKTQLQPYLNSSSSVQRLLLAALVQLDQEAAPIKTLTFLMNEIAKRRPSEGIDKKLTGRDFGGARAGMTLRRKPLGKEDIVEFALSLTDKLYYFKIKKDYKQIVTEWVRSENLWVKEELG
jgi:hypothetical protein